MRVSIRRFGRRSWTVLIFSGLALTGFTTLAAAQQEAASIIGQVTDESGAVLPGVTVTASSPSLQTREMSAVTNERGEYRLTPLPIGTYAVDYSLSGFSTVKREDVRLTVGFVAKIDVQLKVGSLEETVVVSGQSPIVDVSSTASRTQLTKETLELTPTSRNGVIGLMAQAPGVRPNLDVGGSTLNSVPSFHAFGQDGESWQAIEGVVTDSPKTGNQGGNYWDYSAFEEAKVQTVANDVDTPNRGINMNAIIKSGGNDFHGGAFFAKTSKSFQSSNVTSDLAAQGITTGNPIETRSDASGELGGRVVRDKVWFYYSGRRREEIDDVVNAFKPDGSPATQNQLQGFSTEKASYQLSKSNRLVGFSQWSHKNLVSGVTQFVPWESRSNEIFNSNTSKIEWQGVKGSSLIWSVQYGYWGWHAEYHGFSPNPATTDQVTTRATGITVNEGQRSHERRDHTRAALTWYKPDFFHGNHEIKFGLDVLANRADRQWVSRGSVGNYQLIYRSGVPFELAAYDYPVNPEDLSHYTGAYVSDTWTIARRFTINAGLRYAHDNGFAPPQCRVAADPPSNVVAPDECFPLVQFNVWNPITPRIHFAYDLTGNGKTVVKGGWGRFAHMRGVDEVQEANSNVATTTTYLWHDLNGNKLYDAGEINLDPNGSDFVSTAVQGVGAALAGGIPNPNEEEPATDEWSASFERELMANFGIRATGIYSRTMNSYRLQNNFRPYDVYTIGITNPDPGPDGKVNTADDPGRTITYYEYPTALAGAKFQQPMLVNDPKADATYKSFEIAASKRMSSRWQLMASYSATKKHVPLVPNAGSLGGLTVYLNTSDPNAEINNSDNTWEWLGRLSGAYNLPFDALVSFNYEHRSGNPFARTVTLTGGKTIPSITVNAEPIGTERYPNLNLLDLRAEKSLRFKGQRISVRMDVFNSLNSNAVTSQSTLSGPNFLKPTAILPPRTFELSAAYRF